MNMDFITPELHDLQKIFRKEGFDLRLVGGVVRDTVAGHAPKDIDLCTDAEPTEQVEIYKKNNIRFVPTGIDHGTVTVVLDSVPYEITSLRLDIATDGRRATVAYTRNWNEDLERRDLTINAMSMTFDGTLIDPFGGQEDLQRGRIRFVGDPDRRIREDYLRILRWFRFVGRFGHAPFNGTDVFDLDSFKAITRNVDGLRQISRERVWSEVKAILKHVTGPGILDTMCMADVNIPIDMPGRTASNGEDAYRSCKSASVWTCNPEVLMLAWCGYNEQDIAILADAWKWSNAEREHVDWLARTVYTGSDLRRLIAVDNAPRDWVVELSAIENRQDNSLFDWQFSPFPVSGNDLIAAGVKPGPWMGRLIAQLRNVWADSDYTATKSQLMKRIRDH